MKRFRQELEEVINKHSMENGSNTPDFILAKYLIECLRAFDRAVGTRDNWINRNVMEEVLREKTPEERQRIAEIFRNKITDTSKFGHSDFIDTVNQRFGNVEKPHAITFAEAEQMASDINYHNRCARATLGDLPEVKPEDLMKDLNKQIDKSKVIEIEPLTIKEGTSKPRKRNPNTL